MNKRFGFVPDRLVTQRDSVEDDNSSATSCGLPTISSLDPQ